MKKLAFTTILFLSFLTLGQSQTMQAWIDEGEKAFEEGDYYGAYKCYEIALRYKAARLEKYDSIRTSMLYNYAEAARLAQMYGRADSIYQQVLKSPNAKHFPLTKYWLGKVVQFNIDSVDIVKGYERAQGYFHEFLEQTETVSEEYALAAEIGLENINWAFEVLKNRNKKAQVVNLGANINSEFSDYASAFRGNNTMYYSSYRFLNKKDSLVPPRYYMRIMKSVAGSPGEELPESINVGGRHVAHTAFNRDASMVYYTVCDFVKKDTIQCKLFRAKVQADGSWKEPKELTLINSKHATNTHPNVGLDTEVGKEVLYFSSDRPGGKGGLDIWYSYIDYVDGDVKLSTPQNLEAINTEMNEATPYFYSDSQTLFFSTDGYRTLGGMDVYQSKKRENNWTIPEHLGMPVNSAFNDLYYVLRKGDSGQIAYFSSNRPNVDAVFWDKDNEYCCNDIYRMRLPMIDLLARTFNLEDSSQLTGATVVLYEKSPAGDLIPVDSIAIHPEYEFHFSIDPTKDYVLKGMKDGFSSDTVYVDPDQHRGQSTIIKNLYLDPNIDLLVNTWHLLDNTPLDSVVVSLYELSANGDTVALNQTVNPDGNQVTFDIKRKHKYMVKGVKPGFIGADSVSVDPSGPQYADRSEMEVDLYLGQMLEVNTFEAGTLYELTGVRVELYDLSEGEPRLIHDSLNLLGNDFKYPLHLDRPYMIRATKDGYAEVIDTLRFEPQDAIKGEGYLIFDVYLPLPFEVVLYYDNDHPNPRTRIRRTRLAYTETNKAYYQKKESFIKGFTEGMSREESFVVSRRFSDFFDRDVQKAPEVLIEFSERLINELRTGANVTLILTGSASPRGNSAYNDDLAARRIDCVKNHFRRYVNSNDESLRPYIESGKLTFIENNFGESNYDPENLTKIEKEETVSSDPDDIKGSIYDLRASARRHVRVRLVTDEGKQKAPNTDARPLTTRDNK